MVYWYHIPFPGMNKTACFTIYKLIHYIFWCQTDIKVRYIGFNVPVYMGHSGETNGSLKALHSARYASTLP